MSSHVRVPFLPLLGAAFLVAAVLIPSGRAAFVGLALVCGVLGWAAHSIAREKADKLRLHRDGVPGVARIRSVRQAAVQPKSRGHLNVELELDLDVGGTTRTVARREPVPELHVARLATGLELAVRLDPLDPAKFLIVWDAPSR